MCSNFTPRPPAGDAASEAVRDWLETQSRVVSYWREVLIAAGGELELVGALDAHADFLAAAARRRSAEIPSLQ
ncbi:hypothetical protein [Maricaulis sp.]|uniref:hypothetical protein n=1 Tax=Maricaulis sp. TaxID=1486257 RepID=UPI0026233D6D|nr:hypothetical protein [Maricaulis sp.]